MRPHAAPSVWREVELLERHTLHDLHHVLQTAFELDNQHLYAFYLNNNPFDRIFSYDGPGASDAKHHADRTTLAALPLKVNKRFLYLFDFGDEHHHEVQVLRRGEASAGVSYPRIVAEEGEAPEQYPEWDDPDLADDSDDDGEQADEGVEPEDSAQHCHHDEVESTISTSTRERLERMIPDIIRAVAARRIRRSSMNEAFEEDDHLHEDERLDLEPGDVPAAAREELIRDYELATELLRSAEGDLGVVHVVIEHAAKENVVGWLFQLPEVLSGADLHDAALDLASALHAAEPDAGMNYVLPAILLKAGRIEAADVALREPLDADPDNPELLRLKAELSQVKGDTQAAIEYYQAALEWTGSQLSERAEIAKPLCELLEATGKRAVAAQLQQRELELVNSLSWRRGLAPRQGTVVRDQPKVGRNDPCTCGSGKKYKKCCGKAS